MDTRTLLYGEWHPVVRDPLDIARIAFMAGFGWGTVRRLPGGAESRDD
ncbi:MAG TPA: hypothetical protein VJ744_08465 [Gaiellaceae bacterium]|nr:hypothetical protein [Gaiellaceae bacterium]